MRRIGLTSKANARFVEQSALYDTMLAYDAVDTLAVEGGATILDFAGSAEILATLYDRLPGRIAYTLRVGVTHHEAARERALPLVPQPVSFFAPNAAVALIGEIGQEGFDADVVQAWRGFVAEASALVSVERGAGAQACSARGASRLAGGRGRR